MEYAGAVYHVMNRADHGGRIFLDKQDFELFLVRMKEVCGRTGWVFHSYVLIPNHFHWLLETPEANLVAGMKWFLGAYTQGFNTRHGRRGHLFQGRYKALPVETGRGEYFETVSTYIHLNPARAKLLRAGSPDLEKYQWSSYPSYIAEKKARPGWLEVRRVLGNIGLRDDSEGRRRYEEYLKERMMETRTRAGRRIYKTLWDEIRHGWCLGGEEFQEEILERIGMSIEGKEADSYSGEATERYGQREAEKLVRKGMKALGVSEDDLLRERKSSLLKSALAWHVHKSAMVTHKWISERLQTGSPTNLTVLINRFKHPVGGEVLRLRKILERA